MCKAVCSTRPPCDTGRVYSGMVNPHLHGNSAVCMVHRTAIHTAIHVCTVSLIFACTPLQPFAYFYWQDARKAYADILLGLLLLSSDTAYKAQGCSVVLHVVESTDRTMTSETLKILWMILSFSLLLQHIASMEWNLAWGRELTKGRFGSTPQCQISHLLLKVWGTMWDLKAVNFIKFVNMHHRGSSLLWFLWNFECLWAVTYPIKVSILVGFVQGSQSYGGLRWKCDLSEIFSSPGWVP